MNLGWLEHASQYPPPPVMAASLFSILCPQSIHNTSLNRLHKSLLLNTLRDSRQNILSKGVTRKVFRTKDLSALARFCPIKAHPRAPHLPSQARWFSRIPPTSRRVSTQADFAWVGFVRSQGAPARRWRLTPLHLNLLCGYVRGREENAFRKTTVTMSKTVTNDEHRSGSVFVRANPRLILSFFFSVSSVPLW